MSARNARKMPITEQELAEIEARAAYADSDNNPWVIYNGGHSVPLNELARLAHADVPALVAEVRRLRAKCAEYAEFLSPIEPSPEDCQLAEEWLAAAETDEQLSAPAE